MSMTRRNFLNATAMGAAVTMAAGAVVASADEAPAAELTPEQAEGMKYPWCGPGSVKGDWNGTPAEIKALGGCTMPLDELNARRAMYVDAQTEYVCSDGTVIPEVYVKVRALLNTYGFGVGNVRHDHCFDWPMHEMTEDEAWAYLAMPRGVQFTSYEFAACSDYTIEECEAFLEELCRKGWLHRVTNYRGTLYMHIANVLGLDEYHVPQILRGETNIMDFVYIDGPDVNEIAFNQAGQPLGYYVPCTKDVVKDGAIYPLDDIIELAKTKNKFSVSPCCCRTLGGLGAGLELPEYPDGDFNLTGITSPVCGHDIETCLCLGDEAEFWIEHKVGREITLEEFIERVQKSVEDGHIMSKMGTEEAEVVCSCHGDCCGIIAKWKAVGAGSRTFKNVSHYTLEVSQENCLKCGLCAQRCPMAIIAMDEETGFPVLADQLCMKCGQCAYVCPTQSRWLVPKAQDEFVPDYVDIMTLNNVLGADRFENGLIW